MLADRALRDAKDLPNLLPVVGVPFKWVGMDLVGTLQKNEQGHHYILVIVECAM